MFFTMRMVKHWSKFPREFLRSPYSEAFRAHLNRALSPLFQLNLLGVGHWTG